ncbi:DegT/DnrJ/EryC1/StrS family aminotransferase [bacterium]|nr:DegT/DnrJ/EryC1/StrS family aminotransferase [candidate division CSSED10-310 bacterium]
MSRVIPFIDLVAAHRPLKKRLLAAVADVIDSGAFILGEPVAALEQQFAARIGRRHAIGVNSGTDALLLCLLALGTGPGDEVVTAANSFIATAAVIAHCGALPRFCDVDADENMSPDNLLSRLGPRTRVVLPVHLRGRPCNMVRIMDICAPEGIHVVEDCSQSFGAHFNNVMTGAFGCAGCFSLHPIKVLGALGDAGMIVTDDDALDDELRRLRNHGLLDRDTSGRWGYNSRLDTVQAAMLLVKLAAADDWIAQRRRHARQYIEGLAGLPVTLPVERTGEFHVYSMFTLFTPERDDLKTYLAEHGIETKIHYPVPIHRQPAARSLAPAESLETTERQAAQMLSLPVYPELTPADVAFIIARMRDFFRAGA